MQCALEETETLLLWKGLILLWCPAPRRAPHPGNQKLRDSATFTMGHGMPCFLGALLDLNPPPGHFSLENQLSPENTGSSDEADLPIEQAHRNTPCVNKKGKIYFLLNLSS